MIEEEDAEKDGVMVCLRPVFLKYPVAGFLYLEFVEHVEGFEES